MGQEFCGDRRGSPERGKPAHAPRVVVALIDERDAFLGAGLVDFAPAGSGEAVFVLEWLNRLPDELAGKIAATHFGRVVQAPARLAERLRLGGYQQ